MKEKFYQNFQNKSNLELEEIVLNAKDYQKEAVSLAKQILANRKNNPEQIAGKEKINHRKTETQKPPHKPKYSLEERRRLNSLYKKKSRALFVEYFLFSFLFVITLELFQFISQESEVDSFLKIYSICFFTYYSTSEFLFKKTLVMHFYGLEIKNLNRLSFRFILYTLASVIDRTVFAPFHMLFAPSNDLDIFLCEKVSGIRWELNEE